VIHPHCVCIQNKMNTYSVKHNIYLIKFKKKLHVSAKVNRHFQAVYENIKLNLKLQFIYLRLQANKFQSCLFINLRSQINN